jgi:hypothetical protein
MYRSKKLNKTYTIAAEKPAEAGGFFIFEKLARIFCENNSFVLFSETKTTHLPND